MSCFGRRVDIPGDRRKAARRPAVAIGSAVSVSGSRSIVVEDVGLHGVKVRGRGLPGIGKQVLIWTDELYALGSVVWARFGQRGISFDVGADGDAFTKHEPPLPAVGLMAATMESTS